MTLQKILLLLILSCQIASAEEVPLIRLGVLAFGTVNWELSAMQKIQQKGAKEYRLQVMKMANPQAGKIALQSGAVDMIVADWIWVSRQRALGKDYTFYPYSNATGALVVAKDSSIKQLADLTNKKIAIAGGELDKNSLLLQALMQKQGQAEVFVSMQKVYGAPPLLSQQMQSQRVDALLTYWHYAARMQAEGYRVLMTGDDILQGLGVQVKVPSIGYVFDRGWAENNKAAIQSFLNQTRQAKDVLCAEEAAWQKIQALIKASTEQDSQLLRQRYCDGRVRSWGEKEKIAATQIYQYLRVISKQRLTGDSAGIQSGAFWY